VTCQFKYFCGVICGIALYNYHYNKTDSKRSIIEVKNCWKTLSVIYKINDLKSVKVYGSGDGSKVENFPILFRQEDIDQQMSCVCVCVCVCVQSVPLATEPGISLILLSLMRILQRNLKRTYLIV
jgi:hypothetical protein